jgi:hypothetical protein
MHFGVLELIFMFYQVSRKFQSLDHARALNACLSLKSYTITKLLTTMLLNFKRNNLFAEISLHT